MHWMNVCGVLFTVVQFSKEHPENLNQKVQPDYYAFRSRLNRPDVMVEKQQSSYISYRLHCEELWNLRININVETVKG